MHLCYTQIFQTFCFPSTIFTVSEACKESTPHPLLISTITSFASRQMLFVSILPKIRASSPERKACVGESCLRRHGIEGEARLSQRTTGNDPVLLS